MTIDNSDYVFATVYDDALARRDSAEATRVQRPSLLNADTFDALAQMMERRGYTFATLDAVLSDSAYQRADTYVGPAGITWLHRWALTSGMRGATFAGEPEVPPDIAARAAR